MTAVDSRTYLEDGGYLQKGRKVNLREVDLEKKVSDLLPSRYYPAVEETKHENNIIQMVSGREDISVGKTIIILNGSYPTKMKAHYKSYGTWRASQHASPTLETILPSRCLGGVFFSSKQLMETSMLFTTCKFHGWTYKPDGSLHKAREYDKLADFDRKQHSLFPIHTHITAQGFIFINFDSRDVPETSFEDQFGDDFDPAPKSATGKEIGNEYSLFAQDEYEYDHTWNSDIAGTNYNWKTFVDGFQECYHCLTGHPTTLPKDFCLKEYYLRQGIGASRHFLPPAHEDLSEAYITWLYPLGVITFSDNLLFIVRFNLKGALDTSYESETYRRTKITKPSPEYDDWMNHEIAYWRLVEKEDVELAVDAQKGFKNGVLGKGRIHPTQEHAVKWYQDKVREVLTKHATLEGKEKRNIDYSIPRAESDYEEADPLCKLMGPEYEW